MFDGFRRLQVPVGDAVINGVIGGSGPPLLLLHGYPQTHVAWHRVAPALSRIFTVVATDLRGYGDSTAPPTDAQHTPFSKRAMAADQVAVMRHLGFDRFAVVGHDRGGRVGYRLALDHPRHVSAFVSLTVIPTHEVWQRADKAFALGAYHWFLFAQPFDLPERLAGADPDFFLDWTLRKMTRERSFLTPAAMAEYRRCFRRPEVRHAMMEDYRAAASIDAAIDAADVAAGRKLACPVHVLWEAARHGGEGETPLETWRRWTDAASGEAVDAGHLMAEEVPDAVLAGILPFLRQHAEAM
ncbi:alpha/beta fold hydrolase [Reyranella sp. CPCC 100927]|uniref:alpha/beta fold hydrolase n=1 Tax=Reyranella sp. CPCC 100927 TaxID=2599616 RepID=UPI0011B4213A|nr:alpha/beta hydrolase [Reyranella sp. CPCC 100927]TWT13921.1 alpha/beta hydrolase [Reyranella sp. CPCC 100927]